MKRRGKLMLVIAAAAAAAVALAGCTPVQKPADSSTNKTHGFTYGISLYASGNTFAAAMNNAATAEAKKLGDSVIIVTDGQFDPEKQGKDVQDIVARKPDAMLLAAGDTAQGKAWVDQSAEAGVPVFGLFNAIDHFGKPLYAGVTAAAQIDEIASGYAAGKIALGVLKPGDAAGVILGQAGYAEVQDRLDGFTKAIRSGDFKVYSTPNGDWTTLHGQQGCQDLIAAHPDIKVIYSESDGMSVGCIQASNIGNIKVVGNGGSTDGLKLVASGGMLGTTCYGPGSLAAQVVQMAHAYLAGDKAVRGKLDLIAPTSITSMNATSCVQEW
jgi:ribose transport system substrate-binding protein